MDSIGDVIRLFPSTGTNKSRGESVRYILAEKLRRGSFGGFLANLTPKEFFVCY